MEKYVIAALVTFLVFLAILPIIALAFAARTNYHVRKDNPDTAKLKSTTRWNFWTGGLAAWGGSIRLLVADSSKLSDYARKLQKWTQHKLIAGLAIGLPTNLIPSKHTTVVGITMAVALLPTVYFLVKLPKYTGIQNDSVSASAKQALRNLLIAAAGFIAFGVLLKVSAVLASIALSIGLVFLVKHGVHYCRLGLNVANAVHLPLENETSRTGGKDTLAMLIFIALAVTASFVVKGIGVVLFG